MTCARSKEGKEDSVSASAHRERGTKGPAHLVAPEVVAVRDDVVLLCRGGGTSQSRERQPPALGAHDATTGARTAEAHLDRCLEEKGVRAALLVVPEVPAAVKRLEACPAGARALVVPGGRASARHGTHPKLVSPKFCRSVAISSSEGVQREQVRTSDRGDSASQAGTAGGRRTEALAVAEVGLVTDARLVVDRDRPALGAELQAPGATKTDQR